MYLIPSLALDLPPASLEFVECRIYFANELGNYPPLVAHFPGIQSMGEGIGVAFMRARAARTAVHPATSLT